MREEAHCHGAASRCCLSTPQASSYALPPSNASGHLGRTHYWLLTTWNKLIMNDTLPIEKQNIVITFTLEQLWRTFFWSRRQFSHLLRRGNFCFIIVAAHPSFITCFEIFQKVFISIQTIKHQLTEWRGSLFVHLSADTAQILRQHVTSSVCQSK